MSAKVINLNKFKTQMWKIEAFTAQMIIAINHYNDNPSYETLNIYQYYKDELIKANLELADILSVI